MPAPTIADYLKYADLQMAAEALYDFNAKKDAASLVPGAELFNKAIDSRWLTTGNEHASKFTAVDAQKFAAEWTVVDHISNTKTGFSGTLFQNKDDGKYYLGFRSTEFLDDAARDNQATNVMEVKEHGWAFGQIADMENCYKELSKAGGALDGRTSPAPATSRPTPTASGATPTGLSNTPASLAAGACSPLVKWVGMRAQ